MAKYLWGAIRMVSFCIPVSEERAEKIYDWFKERNLLRLLVLLTEWGVAVPEKAKFVLDLEGTTTEKGVTNWFSTIDFLERSKDGVTVRLNHPLQKDKSPLPCARDLFKIVDGDDFIKFNENKDDVRSGKYGKVLCELTNIHPKLEGASDAYFEVLRDNKITTVKVTMYGIFERDTDGEWKQITS